MLDYFCILNIPFKIKEEIGLGELVYMMRCKGVGKERGGRGLIYKKGARSDVL